MAAVALFAAIALLRGASAENFSTTMNLPDLLFLGPYTQTFVGEMFITASTTYYTLNCGSKDSNFWPGADGCTFNNSYTFSASSATTRYLMPNVNLDQNPGFSNSRLTFPLQSFNQTATIDCGSMNTASTVHCMTTLFYNNETAGDKSMISPTRLSTTYLESESHLYRVFFTRTTAAAAASTPLFLIPSSTTKSTTTNPAPTTITSSPPTPTSTSSKPPAFKNASSEPRIPSSTANPALTSGSKAGIGIGVLLGVGALAGIAMLLRRHGKHKQRSRMGLAGNPMVPLDGQSDEEKKDLPENDNRGVYELPARRSPVQLHAGELERYVPGKGNSRE